jgi:hypothetical protein
MQLSKPNIPLQKAHYSFAAGCKRCFISELGYSTFSEESGRWRSQAHFSTNSDSNSPSSIWVIYLPSTGKNLKPWKEPQVATYRPLEAEWGEMIKSEEVVKASLFSVRFSSLK